MSEKKPMPKCPYCGCEMHLDNNEYVVQACYNGDEEQKRYWYRCNNEKCNATSPLEKTAWKAYRTAMRRCDGEATNRVLTLGEAQYAYYNTEKPIPCELRWYLSALHQVAWIADAVTSYNELSKDMREVIENEKKVDDVDDLNGAYIQWRECLDWDNYGITWRCWLQKPSNREMRNTPWEGS